MAFRAVARRSPAVSSQVRALLQPGRQQLSRGHSTQPEYTGDAFNEKEKAAENRYIHNMEEERRQAAAAKAAAAGTPLPAESPASPLKTDAVAEGGFRNIAVVAGLVAAVAGYWLLSGSSKKEEKEST